MISLYHPNLYAIAHARQVLVISFDNTSSFWKILKRCYSINSVDDSISCEELFQYFHGRLFDVNIQAVNHDAGNDHEYAYNNATVLNDPFELSETSSQF